MYYQLYDSCKTHNESVKDDNGYNIKRGQDLTEWVLNYNNVKYIHGCLIDKIYSGYRPDNLSIIC